MRIAKPKRFIFALTLVVAIIAVVFWMRFRPAQRFDFSPVEAGQLRVVTWNVGYFAIAANKNMRDEDIIFSAALLKESQSQIIILQELSAHSQADRMAELIGNDWVAYSVSTGHGQQVLSIITAMNVVEEEDVVCGGRYAKGLSFQLAGDQTLYVLGVHAPHPARGIDLNYESIVCAAEHVKNRKEGIRIFGGDLNYNFDPGEQGDFYVSLMQHFGDGTRHIGETYYAHTRIDHVFHFPKQLPVIKQGSGLIDIPMRFTNVPGFRDHRPILVTYQFE